VQSCRDLVGPLQGFLRGPPSGAGAVATRVRPCSGWAGLGLCQCVWGAAAMRADKAAAVGMTHTQPTHGCGKHARALLPQLAAPAKGQAQAQRIQDVTGARGCADILLDVHQCCAGCPQDHRGSALNAGWRLHAQGLGGGCG